MNLDWSHFHPGHERVVTPYAGGAMVHCLDCGVSADLEAVSAKVSVADACLLEAEAKKRVAQGNISEGCAFRGAR